MSNLGLDLLGESASGLDLGDLVGDDLVGDDSVFFDFVSGTGEREVVSSGLVSSSVVDDYRFILSRQFERWEVEKRTMADDTHIHIVQWLSREWTHTAGLITGDAWHRTPIAFLLGLSLLRPLINS